MKKMKKHISIILIILVLLFSLFSVYSKDIYVSNDTIGTGDGSSIENACNFDTAISSSADGYVIKMMAGNYNITKSINKSINITALQPGKVNIVSGQPNKSIFTLIDSVSVVFDSLNFGKSSIAIQISQSCNLTILNSLIENATESAIHNSGTLIVNNSIFNNNKIFNDRAGGAIYNYLGGNATINNSLFTNNEAEYGGGAIYNVALMSLNNNNFINNTARPEHPESYYGGYFGGAILNNLGVIYDYGSKYMNNTAKYYGGAIHNIGNGLDEGIYISNNTVFINNRNRVGFGGTFCTLGGGINYFNNSIFKNNRAILEELYFLIKI